MENIHSTTVPPRICKCEEYQPKSIQGVIDTDCKNCNGIEPILTAGPDSCIHKNESF
jgi:hypothetical protein